MDDLLELQNKFEKGLISESDISKQELEQLYELYDKQCKEIQNDTNKTLRKLGVVFFDIIADIIEQHCGVKRECIHLHTSVRGEIGKYSYYSEKMFRKIESAFNISISKNEMNRIYTVENILDLVLQKKGVMELC